MSFNAQSALWPSMLHVSERKGSVFTLKTYSALVIPLAGTNYFPEKKKNIEDTL